MPKKSLACDPAFGSSNFAIVATQLVDGKIQIIHAEEYERPDFEDMITEVWDLVHRFGHITNIYCDAANPVDGKHSKRSLTSLTMSNT